MFQRLRFSSYMFTPSSGNPPNKYSSVAGLFFLFTLLSFPLFYFVYKFGNPEPLAHDFFQYYRLYKDWDINNVNAPFNMRLVGAFFVHLLYRCNLYYDTETAFDAFKSWGFLEQVYFDAVFFNFICVVCTCVVLFSITKRLTGNSLLGFLGGLLYLLGFGTIFYQLMPLTDAFAVLLFAIVYNYYLQKKLWILIPLVLLIFQREYMLLAVGLIAFVDAFKFRDRYTLIVIFASACCFTIYYLLRKTVFYTPALDFQSTPGFMINNLIHPSIDPGTYIKQFVLTLNIFLLYLFLLVYKASKKLAVDRFQLFKILLLLLQVHLVTISGGHGNNAGRYFYMLVPVVIVQVIVECRGVLGEVGSRQGQ